MSWWSRLFSGLTTDIAIDLGTANTIVYVKGRGIVLDEPSTVAVINERGFDVPYLFGKQAKSMIGKTPMKISVHKPLKDGVVADLKMAEEMIKHFVAKVNCGTNLISPIIIICVPLESTPVEQAAIQEAAEKCGAREVLLIEEPMAAAIGAYLPIADAAGSMIVDIGGGTTEIAIISLGGVVHGRSIKIGGNTMDDIIVQYIREKYNLLIGETTAENIKKNIGVAYLKPDEKGLSSRVRGRDLSTGTPKEVMINQEDIVHAISDPISKIMDVIRSTLETAQPELASDILDRGIVLTGGGAMLKNFDYVLRETTNLPVFIAPRPMLCVARGAGIVLENYQEYKHILSKQI